IAREGPASCGCNAIDPTERTPYPAITLIANMTSRRMPAMTSTTLMSSLTTGFVNGSMSVFMSLPPCVLHGACRWTVWIGVGALQTSSSASSSGRPPQHLPARDHVDLRRDVAERDACIERRPANEPVARAHAEVARDA